MFAISPYFAIARSSCALAALTLFTPSITAAAQPLDASVVRFITAGQAEFIYEVDFGAANLVETFAIKVGAGANIPTDFVASRRVHITEGKTTASDPHPKLVKDALVSFSLVEVSPVTSGIYEITVRRKSPAHGKVIRFSYIDNNVVISNAYRVVPDAQNLSTASICAIINIQNSSKSNWGPPNGTFLLGGYGIPEATTASPKYQVIGAVPAGGTVAQAAICVNAQSVVHKSSIDLSGLPDAKQKAQPSHPEVTLKLVDWPVDFELPGEITIEGQGIRVPPPTLLVTGTSGKDRLKSFKKNQTSSVTLGADTVILVEKVDTFPTNIEVEAGIISYHEVRKIKFTNTSPDDRTVEIKEDKKWGLVQNLPDQPVQSPTKPQVIGGSMAGNCFIELMEKNKDATTLVTILQPTTSMTGEIQRISDGVKPMKLLQAASKTAHFGAYSADSSTQKTQMESVKLIAASIASVKKFFTSCNAKTAALGKAIQTELARHPYPRSISDKLQQELDKNLRSLRSRRDKVDELLARAVEDYNKSARSLAPLDLNKLTTELGTITHVLTSGP